jgi:hypothetical protein
MNREQRRHPEKPIDPTKRPDWPVREPGRNQDDLDPRAKNSGHGKKTADKWNQ